MKRKYLLALVALLGAATGATAMESTLLSPLDQQRLLQEDADIDGPVPLRVSIGYPVSVAPTASKLVAEKGDHVWRHAFEVPGATEMSLAFGDFALPTGAQLFVYDVDKTYIRGPYTSADIREHGELWTPVVPGEKAIVELILPGATDQHAAKGRAAPKPVSIPKLRVMQVNAGYRDLFGREGKPNLSRQLACNIDVICPQADDWRDEMRAVARYTINIGGSLFLCTGQLVMDQPGTLTPWFMTAHHCGPSAATDQTMVFYWNFESPTCGQLGGGNFNQTQIGAIYTAGRQNVDSSLVRLEEMPDESFGVYYAGWDASGGVPSGGSVGIHHPGGHEKSFSDNTGTASSISVCIAGTNQSSGFWLLNWEEGTTEPGSSGSALWHKGNKKVIGTLSGGSSACIGDQPNGQSDCYGKTWAAWTGGSDDSQRLQPWLDPNDTGLLMVDGQDPTAGECGDSALNIGEACDDGNAASGDGCSSSCQVESGFECELPVNQRGIADGSFENGTPNSKWGEFSTNYGSPICTNSSCGFGVGSDGIWFGYFGREPDGEIGRLEQRIVIPDDATTLSFNLVAFSCDSPSDYLSVTIDGVEIHRVNGDDPDCNGFTYLPRLGDVTAFADNGAHLLRFESRVTAVNGGESQFFIDEVTIDGDTSGPGAAGACTPLPEVCVTEDFNAGPGLPAGWNTFSTGTRFQMWGTSDDGECNSNPETADGNFTGGDGVAACVDSDVAGPGQVDTYLCGPSVDLSTAISPVLSFLHNYQIDGPPDAGDSFSLLVGTAAPAAESIGSYDLVFEQLIDGGAAFDTPGFEANLDLSAYVGQQVYTCFRYRGDDDWYGQVDDYEVTAQTCVSDIDTDGDGVFDSVDNCTLVLNPAQRDTDGDNIGNSCDADIDNNCTVNFVDSFVYRDNFFVAGDFDTDNNGDGITNFLDLAVLSGQFFGRPGPSGLPNACN